MKFWKTTAVSVFFIVALTALLVMHILHISSMDQEDYKELMAVSNSKTALKTETDYTARQLKEGTKKTLLLSQGDERKVGTLSSESSTLLFAKENQASQLIEEMQNIHLIYQEDLIVDKEGNPFQIVVHVNADKATYFYSQEKLTAENVDIARYKLPSHLFSQETIEENLFLSGTASQLSITFIGKQPVMQASHLKTLSHKDFSNLDVGDISFNGSKLRLTGNFNWTLPIGNIHAKAATARINGEILEEIVMQEGVEISLKEGGFLYSPYGRLDCKNWMALFHGNEEEKISYENPLKDFKFLSLRMEFQFFPPKDGQVHLERLVADDSVEMTFGSDLHILSSQAILSPLSLKKFDEVKIELKAPVKIQWVGTIESEGNVTVIQKQKQLLLATVDGLTQISFNSLKDEEHRLVVQGSLLMNPVLKKIEMTSPKTPDGGVDEKRQIFFSDSYGQIFSDQMTLFFKEDEKDLKPVKLLLNGNVRLLNNTPGTNQFALADEAVFEFDKNILTLQALSRPRVLFYDELNKVQASARGLVINRDSKTGQNVMRGLGNVRFMFAEEELNELKKRFSFEPRK